MPVAANPILWSDVPELSSVDTDEHMILLKKVSTSPDVTEWRRYKIGDYFQEMEGKFEQLKTLLTLPKNGTWIPSVTGITLVHYTNCNWHTVQDRLFFSCDLVVSGSCSSFIVSGLPKNQIGMEAYTVNPATAIQTWASYSTANTFAVALLQLATHSNSLYRISGSYRFNP